MASPGEYQPSVWAGREEKIDYGYEEQRKLTLTLLGSVLMVILEINGNDLWGEMLYLDFLRWKIYYKYLAGEYSEWQTWNLWEEQVLPSYKTGHQYSPNISTTV